MFGPQSFLLRSLLRSEQLLPLALFLVCLCRLPISVATDEEGGIYEWDADQYPNMSREKEAKFCTGPFRNPPSAICDPDFVLAKQEAIDLDKLIRAPDNVTVCMCEPCPPNRKGLSIKVAILMSVKKRSNQTLEDTIEQFAGRTRSNWNFAPVCRNDVLIFVANTYNKVYISMGAKAERVIGTSTANEIIEKSLTHFKYGHTYQGLESIILSIKAEAQHYDPRFDRLGIKQGLIITISAGLVSLAVIIVAVWWCIKREARRTKKILANGANKNNNNNKGNNNNNNNNSPDLEQQLPLVNSNTKE